MTHISGFERSQILLLPEAWTTTLAPTIRCGSSTPLSMNWTFQRRVCPGRGEGEGPPGYAPADLLGVVARIWRGLAFGQEEAVEGWFVKLPSGFPSDAEQAQRRSSHHFGKMKFKVRNWASYEAGLRRAAA